MASDALEHLSAMAEEAKDAIKENTAFELEFDAFQREKLRFPPPPMPGTGVGGPWLSSLDGRSVHACAFMPDDWFACVLFAGKITSWAPTFS